MKSTNVPKHDDRPPSRCHWCLAATWGENVCRLCRGIDSYSKNEPTDAHELKGGRWVTRGGIKVWTGPRPLDDDQIVKRPPAECGTESGYTRHRRRQEKACDDCKEAKRLATERRARREGVKPRYARPTKVWRRADLLREYAKLKEAGFTQLEAAERLGTTPKAIQKAKERARLAGELAA